MLRHRATTVLNTVHTWRFDGTLAFLCGGGFHEQCETRLLRAPPPPPRRDSVLFAESTIAGHRRQRQSRSRGP